MNNYFIKLTLASRGDDPEMHIRVNPKYIVRVEPYEVLSSTDKDPGQAVVVMTDAHLIVLEHPLQIMEAIDKWASSGEWLR